MAYRTRIPVRFGDCDPAGIVYFPRFFNFFHGCFEDFFRDEAHIAYREVIMGERVGFPVVHLEADFKSPLRQGDLTEVELSVMKLGRTSITCRYRVFLADTQKLCGESRITVATVNLDTLVPLDIPAKYRAAFERHLEAPAAS
jgi:4-hydroxybenzoyl-CoA thioesterase